MHPLLEGTLLYGIIDLGYVKPEDIEFRAQQLIAGGSKILQLRAKNQSQEDILKWAKQLKPICNEARVLFIVNDFPEIAKEVNADGVHIGQEDGSLANVRKTVGNNMIVGRSTHSVEQAKTALAEGFDYIGFGPVYPTPTKKGRPAIGLENITEVEKLIGSQIPVFCIGGITPNNLTEVIHHGAKRVVIVSALLCAENPTATVQKVISTLS